MLACKAVLNIASQITDIASNYGMLTFFLSSWKTTWETEFVYKITKLRVSLWQASTFFRLEASVSKESILEALKLRLPFNSPLRNPAEQILCNYCSYFLLCCIIYIFLIFLLKANPPPVLVNTDSLDTPTYVSICFLSITTLYNASSLDLLSLISNVYFTLQYMDLLSPLMVSWNP